MTCIFEIWDKKKKVMRKCGIENTDMIAPFLCPEHREYVKSIDPKEKHCGDNGPIINWNAEARQAYGILNGMALLHLLPSDAGAYQGIGKGGKSRMKPGSKRKKEIQLPSLF